MDNNEAYENDAASSGGNNILLSPHVVIAGGVDVPPPQVPAMIRESIAELTQADDDMKCCWICFETEREDPSAVWVQPCKCRGATKWVHNVCIRRWVEIKRRENGRAAVACPQCLTQYIIVFPRLNFVTKVLEAFDILAQDLSPFLAAGAFIGIIYWSAVTYGAVTFIQIVGFQRGIALLESSGLAASLIGLPLIPVGLIAGRMFHWEDYVYGIIRNRRRIYRKFLPNRFFRSQSPDEQEEEEEDEDEENGELADDEEEPENNDAPNVISAPLACTRTFCGAIVLPTISIAVGRLLFGTFDNAVHRTLLGGLTFIAVKGILKIYLKHMQITRKRRLRVVDYTRCHRRYFLHDEPIPTVRGVFVNDQGNFVADVVENVAQPTWDDDFILTHRQLIADMGGFV